MPLKDPVKRRAYHRRYMTKWLKNPANLALHRKRVMKGTRKRYDALQVLLQAFKADGCAKCSEKTPCCLSAHHIDRATKLGTIALMIRDRVKVERFSDELKKCICLCENCHRKVHAGVLKL